MRKIFLAGVAALALTACTTQVEPCITSYEMDKFGKVIVDDCEPTPPVTVVGLPPVDGDDPDVDSPDTPDVPDDDDPDTPDGPDDSTPKAKVKGNNGWGNGDQAAPGKSRDRNRAENSNKTHRNHGKAINN